MSAFVQDFRFAIRMLAKNRGFTIVALLTLAIGIGATAAMFSVLNGVLLRPLAFEHPERIVSLYEALPRGGTGSVSVPNFLDWRAQNTSFQELEAHTITSVNLQRDQDAQRVRALMATANYFEVFKLQPILGRTFAPGEDSAGHDHVVVLSEALWKNTFGGDPSVVGKTIPLDGEPYTVIGVVPPGAALGYFAGVRFTAEIFTPLTFTQAQLQSRGSHSMIVTGRLKPGVTLEQATEEMKVIAARLEKQYPDIQGKRSVVTRSLQDNIVRGIRPALLVMFGAVLFVLVIACINVINLMLARAAARRREIAIRTALGAGRMRLLRQFMAESVVLSFVAALLGLELAQIGTRILVNMAAGYLPRAQEITLDWHVLAFAMAAALFCAIAVGVAPAMQIAHGQVQDQLKEAGTTTSNAKTNRLRSVLAVGQIATALVLLVGAGLLLASLYRLSKVEPGLNADNVLTFKLNLPSSQYDTTEKTAQYYSELQRRLESIPNVQSAAMINLLPIEQYGYNGPVEIVGLPYNRTNQSPSVEIRDVTPGYFKTLGIPVVSGRDITESDTTSTQPVILVNEAFEKVFFNGETAIGHVLNADNPRDRALIIGVVKDVHQSGLANEPRPELYQPYAQDGAHQAAVLVKTSGDPLSIVGAVREQVRSLDARQAIFDVDNLQNVIARSLSSSKLNATLMSVFAAVATLLAAIGIFGVMSYLVTQHTREIGIRMALGATRGNVLRMVVRHGMTLTVIALAVGSVAALATSRVLQSLLFGVKPIHVGVYAAVEVALLLVALTACLFPALRATKVDPMVALRQAE